ncbi:MAG: hypothetical protein WBG86_22410 [Polyangiales bacterium]
MLVMGVDENGLGPRLGPLVATSVALQVPSYRRAELSRRGLALGLTDSKETGGFGRMAFTESVALALVGGPPATAPTSADGLLRRLWPGGSASLRARCPNAHTAAQCWDVDVRLPAFGGDFQEGRRILDDLVGRSALTIVDVRSRLACAGMLNAEHCTGTNKLEVDLSLFEELIDATHTAHGEPLLAVCGMIGGIRDYASRFSRYGGGRPTPLRARRGQRRYAIRDLGEIRFEVDADARHLPVSLASIVGKYLREVSMLRIGAFYRDAIPGLRLASGYHDPVTRRFIEETEAFRRKRAISLNCFRRQA